MSRRDELAAVLAGQRINCTGLGEVGCSAVEGLHSWHEHEQHQADAVLAWLGEQLGDEGLREMTARRAAIFDDYDGCFERLDGTEAAGEEQLSTDAEDAEWWRSRANVALDVVREWFGVAE